MTFLAITYASTEASEKSGRLGDNALFSLVSYLRREYEMDIPETGVAIDHMGNAINMQERFKLIQKARSVDHVIIFGEDAVRALKNWFPMENTFKVPAPYYFVRSPEKIPLQLLPAINYTVKESNKTKGLNHDKTIG